MQIVTTAIEVSLKIQNGTHTHTPYYYSSLRQKWLLPFTTKWMEMDAIKADTEKQHWMIFLIGRNLKMESNICQQSGTVVLEAAEGEVAWRGTDQSIQSGQYREKRGDWKGSMRTTRLCRTTVFGDDVCKSSLHCMYVCKSTLLDTSHFYSKNEKVTCSFVL